MQIKRLHEYKRQLLNALHIVRAVDAGATGPEHRHRTRAAFLFGAQGGAGLPRGEAHHPADQRHRRGGQQRRGHARALQVAFLPNYRVSLAERIIPAADVSEQISTAGMEASGTGNMKFTLNGALTLGTLDGANIEIREAVGAENFFLFGLTADEVIARKRAGYRPARCTSATRSCARRLTSSRSGFFSPEDRDLFKPLVDSLLEEDRVLGARRLRRLVLREQEEVARTYQDGSAGRAWPSSTWPGRASSPRTAPSASTPRRLDAKPVKVG